MVPCGGRNAIVGAMRGVVAAGHPVTAEAGARVLREGGNAVDAALGAMLASFVAEPQLTGLGAGGYMLVARAGEEPVLLDFFVEAPGRGADPGARGALEPVLVSFGDADQLFHIGPASCGIHGTPAGICAASKRFGTVPLAELSAPAAALARKGVEVNAQQAYLAELLAPINAATPEAVARLLPGGRPPRIGDRLALPELADALDRLGAEGAAPFYSGDIGTAIADWLQARGGLVTHADLAAYETVPRPPLRVAYRGRTVLTNPAPNAGGPLLAIALEHLETTTGEPGADALLAAMEAAQAARTPEFLSRLGSTTHISVLDGEGTACSVTCSNGEGSAQVVPGTGVHLNNMMGEEDLNPLGFFAYPPGRRLPSMMAPTVVLGSEGPEIVLGSAGSNRIRSALLQVIVNVLDRGMDIGHAIDAPRLHVEAGVIYAEPGAGRPRGRSVAAFRARNLFFGGVQAVRRSARGLEGAGDPRRGGFAVTA